MLGKVFCIIIFTAYQQSELQTFNLSVKRSKMYLLWMNAHIGYLLKVIFYCTICIQAYREFSLINTNKPKLISYLWGLDFRAEFWLILTKGVGLLNAKDETLMWILYKPQAVILVMPLISPVGPVRAKVVMVMFTTLTLKTSRNAPKCEMGGGDQKNERKLRHLTFSPPGNCTRVHL